MRQRRRRLSEVEQRNLVVRSGSLQALSQHPSWVDLEDEVGRKRARIERHLVRTALNPSKPVDQREIDYLRGFVNGMQWLVAVPVRAENTLESYLKEQGVTLEGES